MSTTLIVNASQAIKIRQMDGGLRVRAICIDQLGHSRCGSNGEQLTNARDQRVEVDR